MTSSSILWFRQDLRLTDNPALIEAVKSGAIYPLYILDDENAGPHKMGCASRWWLHQSLEKLNASLGGKLNYFKGPAETILTDLVKTLGVQTVYWNRCYEPWRVTRDSKIKADLSDQGLTVKSFNASLLWEPWEVLKQDGTPYKVFSPFYRKGCLPNLPPRPPLPKPDDIRALSIDSSLTLDQLGLLKGYPWYEKLDGLWPIGEEAAMTRAADYMAAGIRGYKELRDFPSLPNTSYMSPNIHFGEISPHQLWAITGTLFDDASDTWATKEKDLTHFRSELGWREFSYYLNYHFNDMQTDNFNPKYNPFPWVDDDKSFTAWCSGQTGIPIVDAAMRQLWQTGLMHNRLRMIVASFLVKNLLIDWRRGERWFWDCLLDADSASNGASWQWAAGCGADAAPYFRIFNPVLQAKKFDPDGNFIRRFVPELSKMPDKYLYTPWEAPPEVMKTAGITLGLDYPHPIVDLKESRDRALAANESIKIPAEIPAE